MWRSKKFIIAVLLAGAMLIGSIGGIVLANDDGDDNQTETRCEALLDRVCEIYEEQTGVAIDQDVLRDAFAQARDEMKSEALQNYLERLVEEGAITQEEADEYLTWWQAKPDISIGFGIRGHGQFFGKGGSCATASWFTD
jgi:hypothetical protein